MNGLKTTIISVLAIGLLVGSAVGVAAQSEESADISTPAYVTWSAELPTSNTDGVFDADTGEARGWAWEGHVIEASDPRLSGVGSTAMNGNSEPDADDVAVLESCSHRIVNDDGAWTGRSTYVEAGDPPMISRESGVLIGEGAYEGLVAFMTGDYREGNQGEAVIMRLSVPPVPDMPAES